MSLKFFWSLYWCFLGKRIVKSTSCSPPSTILSISLSLSLLLLVVPQSTPWSKLIVTHVGNTVKQQCHGSTEHTELTEELGGLWSIEELNLSHWANIAQHNLHTPSNCVNKMQPATFGLSRLDKHTQQHQPTTSTNNSNNDNKHALRYRDN